MCLINYSQDSLISGRMQFLADTVIKKAYPFIVKMDQHEEFCQGKSLQKGEII